MVSYSNFVLVSKMVSGGWNWYFVFSIFPVFSWELASFSCLMLSFRCLLAHFPRLWLLPVLPHLLSHQFSVHTSSWLDFLYKTLWFLFTVREHILAPRRNIGSTFFFFSITILSSSEIWMPLVFLGFFTLPISTIGFYSPNNVIQHMFTVFEETGECIKGTVVSDSKRMKWLRKKKNHY